MFSLVLAPFCVHSNVWALRAFLCIHIQCVGTLGISRFSSMFWCGRYLSLFTLVHGHCGHLSVFTSVCAMTLWASLCIHYSMWRCGHLFVLTLICGHCVNISVFTLVCGSCGHLSVFTSLCGCSGHLSRFTLCGLFGHLLRIIAVHVSRPPQPQSEK